MLLKDIRGPYDYFLTSIAFIYSTIFWLCCIGFIVFCFTFSLPPASVSPCVYLWYEEYYVMDIQEAIEFESEENCLPRGTVDESIYSSLEQQLIQESTPDLTLLRLVPFFIFVYGGGIVLFLYFSTAIAMGIVRLNGVRLGPNQYSDFYRVYENAAKKLEIQSVPPAYIIHTGGDLNAFAVKIARRSMVVFYADLLEHLMDNNKFDEMEVVAAHELTHVKLKHIHYRFFLMPFTLLPFFGKLLSREREYSADRGAYYVSGNKKVVSTTLVKLVVGGIVTREVDINEYINQSKEESDIFSLFAEIISTHPPIPYRIQEIYRLADEK